uniref:G-protein coupled receptors family 1 profile domain-containing protein n=1 Tax=Romanomermis culicivorax TaxID=13658 RepID=A0A915KR31_ROMCU
MDSFLNESLDENNSRSTIDHESLCIFVSNLLRDAILLNQMRKKCSRIAFQEKQTIGTSFFPTSDMESVGPEFQSAPSYPATVRYCPRLRRTSPRMPTPKLRPVKPPIWMQNWRFPANLSESRILAHIPADDFNPPKSDSHVLEWDPDYSDLLNQYYYKPADQSSQSSSRSGDAAAIALAVQNLESQRNHNFASDGFPNEAFLVVDDHLDQDKNMQIGFHSANYEQRSTTYHFEHLMCRPGSATVDSSFVDTSSSVIFVFFNEAMTAEKLAYASIVLMVTFLLVATSVLTIGAIVTSNCRDVIGHYLLSLAVVDLLCGLLIAPLSLYATIIGQEEWTYAALTRPSRYEIEQSPTRCRCWIIFTWITSALLCCPSLFGEEKQARYYKDAYLCILNWSATTSYSVTLAVLVIVPSLFSILFTYSYIFRNLRNPDNLEDNQKMLLDNDPTYAMSFFVIVSFFVSWAPYFSLKLLETLLQTNVKSKILHFTVTWLAISGGCWKIVIYCMMSKDFRKNLLNFVLVRYRKKKRAKVSPGGGQQLRSGPGSKDKLTSSQNKVAHVANAVSAAVNKHRLSTTTPAAAAVQANSTNTKTIIAQKRQRVAYDHVIRMQSSRSECSIFKNWTNRDTFQLMTKIMEFQETQLNVSTLHQSEVMIIYKG